VNNHWQENLTPCINTLKTCYSIGKYQSNTVTLEVDDGGGGGGDSVQLNSLSSLHAGSRIR
jgi:hypothetical protein